MSTPTEPPPSEKAAQQRRFAEITSDPDLARLHGLGSESRWTRIAWNPWTSAAVIAVLIGGATFLAYSYL